MEIRLTPEDGKLLAQIYREAHVLSRQSDNGEMVLRARIDSITANRLEIGGAKVQYATDRGCGKAGS